MKNIKANKKKIIVLALMLVLLAGTGFLNYYLTSTAAKADANQTVSASFFDTYRSDRSVTRDEEFLYLNTIISSEASSDDAVTNAEGQQLSLTTQAEKELILEGLIKAKGFDDCVVTMSTENVNVVVMDTELTAEEAIMILAIIVDETDYTAADVVIIPYV